MKIVYLPNYVTNRIIETPLEISDRDFIFVCSVNPEQIKYSMIISKEAKFTAEDHFRLDLYATGHVGFFGLDVPWYSVLTSNEKLPLHKTTTIEFQRIGKLISLYFNGELVGKHESDTIYNNDNPIHLRVGSRYPSEGSHVADPFIGEISDIRLMTVNWSLERFLWIRHLKEDASYCLSPVFQRTLFV